MVTEKCWAKLDCNNSDANVDMDDGTKEEWDHQEYRNKSKEGVANISKNIREVASRDSQILAQFNIIVFRYVT